MSVSDQKAADSVAAQQADSSEQAAGSPRDQARAAERQSDVGHEEEERVRSVPRQRADKIAAQRARVQSHFAEASAKAAEMLRAARGIEAPEAPTKPVEAPKAAAPTPDLEQVVEARLKAAKAAEQAEARASAAEAKAQAAEAEAARLMKLAKNPAKFLAETGMSVDDFQAQLLNGGEETEDQRFRREVTERAEKAEKAVESMRAEQRKAAEAQVQQKVLDGIRAPLEEFYPTVNALLGPEAVLQHLRAKRIEAGKDIDVPAVLEEMENQFIEQNRRLLQNSKIAAKLGLSGIPSNSEVVAQGPKTITNKTTSSVGAKLPGPRDWEAKRQLAKQILAGRGIK